MGWDGTPTHSSRDRCRGLGYAILAVVLLLFAVAILRSISSYQHRSDQTAARLARQAEHAISTATVVHNGVARCTAPPPSKPSTLGQARMLLAAPTLGLTAPVLQGTTGASLDVGVGHVATSSWPDQGGTDVLAAHDVTFFSHIDHLHPGDALTLTAPCRHWTYRVTGGHVVHAGTPIGRTTEPTLVLVTCWPLDALFYTDRRYLVTAALVSAASTNGGAWSPLARAMPVITPELPAELAHADLSVDALGVPLGRLQLSPEFDLAWRQSSRPLQASDAATHLFDAALLALRQRRPDWWHDLAPGVPITATGALFANPHPLFTAPVDVTVFGHDVEVTAVSMDTATGGYQIHVAITCHEETLTLTAWQMRRP